MKFLAYLAKLFDIFPISEQSREILERSDMESFEKDKEAIQSDWEKVIAKWNIKS